MNWQEYQEAVGELYRQMDDIGTVHKNITKPDKVTRQPRQIDVWIEVQAKNLTLGILVDAKFRKHKLDVKDIEEVIALAKAVGANKAVIVATSGWSEPAEVRASFSDLELHLWTIEEALDLIVPDKWIMCPICRDDCIVMETSGGFIIDGLWSLFTAGQCRGCRAGLAWCWACGEQYIIEVGNEVQCFCKHSWKNTGDELLVKTNDGLQ
jgi:hypothetical protein